MIMNEMSVSEHILLYKEQQQELAALTEEIIRLKAAVLGCCQLKQAGRSAPTNQLSDCVANTAIRLASLTQRFKKSQDYMRQTILAIVEQLDRLHVPNDKEIAKRFFIQGESPVEIAAVIGCSPANVRIRLRRIREELHVPLPTREYLMMTGQLK